MTNSVSSESKAQQVIVGVDTHKYVHVAVAIDTRGTCASRIPNSLAESRIEATWRGA